MTTYRGYTIELDWSYGDPYTKLPNGLVDGVYYRSDEEKSHLIYRKTLPQIKREIDEKIYEKTDYRVYTRNTITKFLYIEDAIKFADKVFGEVRMYVDGEEQEMSFNF